MADRIAVMDHGVLQQVGMPLQIYNDPAKLFVVRFIGSAGMNLLEGQPIDIAGEMAVDLGPLGVTSALHGPHSQALRNVKGRVVYGFRPEQVAVGQGITLAVEVVERIGARTIVHMGAVRVVFENHASLKALSFIPHPASVRVFDAASGVALHG